MLTCQEMTELVTEYLERAMSVARRLRFQMHLGMCRHCREYVRQMKLAIRTLARMPAEPVPEQTMALLLAAFGNQMAKVIS